MKALLRIKLGLGALLFTVVSHAALISTTLEGVAIGETIYDITFVQDEDGWTSFNQIYGSGNPSFVFTTQADALAAIRAIRAAVDAANHDVTPADFRNAFALPFSYTSSMFSYYTGWADDPMFNGVFGPFTRDRATVELFSSFALVQARPNTVPEPSTLALLGVGLVGLAGLRRRRSGR